MKYLLILCLLLSGCATCTDCVSVDMGDFYVERCDCGVKTYTQQNFETKWINYGEYEQKELIETEKEYTGDKQEVDRIIAQEER
jgi:hypothetical protein